MKNNPSDAYGASSPDTSFSTSDPLTQDHSTLNFYLLSAHRL